MPPETLTISGGTYRNLKGYIAQAPANNFDDYKVQLNPPMPLNKFLKLDEAQKTGEYYKIHFFLKIYSANNGATPLVKSDINISRFSPEINRAGDDGGYIRQGLWRNLRNGYYYFEDYTDARGFYQAEITFTSGKESFIISQNSGWIASLSTGTPSSAQKTEAIKLAEKDLGLDANKNVYSDNVLYKPNIHREIQMLGAA